MSGAIHLKIFLSSPRDVADERQAIVRLIKDELPYDPLLRGRATFDVLAWDDGAQRVALLAGQSGQASVDRALGLPADCDLTVVIVRTRLGSPLVGRPPKPDGTQWRSGTEWELWNALGADRPTIICRGSARREVDYSDPAKAREQLEQAVLAHQFFDDLRAAGIFVNDYANMVELVSLVEDQIKRLAREQLDALSIALPTASTTADALWQGSPYPGLRPFTTEETPIFYGRTREIDALFDRVRSTSFVAVIGVSGSGKSSLVLAGLLPRLRESPDTAQWRQVILRPTTEESDDPFVSLAAALAPLYPSEARPRAKALAEQLATDPDALCKAASSVLVGVPEPLPLLLVIDQFEELFRLERADAFIDLLDGGATRTRMRVLVTMRADFYEAASRNQTLAARLSAGNMTLPPPGPEALAAMIRGPARRAGAEVPDELLAALIADAGASVPLPLLAFTLAELWRNGGQSGLSLERYEAMGRLRGALEKRAQHLQLSAEQDAAMPALFSKLVRVTADGRATRQRAVRADVTADPVRRSLEEILIAARFLDPGDERARGIELCHEALLSGWPALRDWLERVRPYLPLVDELRTALARWERSDRREEELIPPGSRLRDAEEILRNAPDLIDLLLREFLERSRDREIRIDRNSQDALRREVLRLVHLAEEQSKAGDADTSILLALEALVHARRIRHNSPIGTVLTTLRNDLCKNETLILRGHENTVRSAALSPDGWSAITSSDDCTARIWDTVSGNTLLVLRGHEGPLRSAMYAPDGLTVLTISDDRTARLWKVASQVWCGDPEHILEGHANSISAIAFSPDGVRVLTGSEDGIARIWDSISGHELVALRGHTRSVRSAVFTPDGSCVLTASDDGTARIWDAASGRELLVLHGHTDWLHLAVFTPDGSRVLTASDDGIARLWDAASGRELLILRGHTDWLRSAVFTLDGSRVLTASDDATARIWDAASGQELLILRGHTDWLRSAVFTLDGSRVLTASDDATARIWDAASGQELLILRGHTDRLRSALFAPDGSRVLTASDDGTARIWDAASGERLCALRGHDGVVRSAVFAPDGAHALTASDDRTARIWDAALGQELLILRGHDDRVLSAIFAPDGARVLTASDDKTARMWGTASGKQLLALRSDMKAAHLVAIMPNAGFSDAYLRRVWRPVSDPIPLVLQGHEGSVLSAAFSPDGTRLLTASDDSTARIWDVASGQELLVLRGHEGSISWAAFAPDGKRVLTASSDHTARVWDAVSGRELLVLHGHDDWVRSAVFAPDGARVLTASDDRSARIWDGLSGQELVVLRGHENWILSAEFAPDGARVLTASNDCTARIWDAASGQELLVLRGHTDWLCSAVFTSDGAGVLTASADSTARIWDAVTGNELQVLRGHESWIHAAVVFQNCARVLTVSGDHTARLWWTFTSVEALVAEAQLRLTRGLSAEERRRFFLPDN